LKNVGISLRVELIDKYNEKRDCISHDWINFLQKINCTPILIPNNLNNVENYISDLDLDAIILSGGDNIGDFPERDKTENAILEFAIKNAIPILGVCRGMQIINYYFEGSLQKNASSNHVGHPHPIDILNNSLISTLKNSKLTVNSFHNNLIKRDDIGKDLEIFALSENDNSVEGYFHKKHPIMGVMWHPERDSNDSSQEKLIEIFFNKIIWEDL
tara:strand:+ start:4335 stop:4979 length:645 start_codon:yes stop_codon:yes gene_type:complete